MPRPTCTAATRHGYLKRVKALFPDKASVLHLFSGLVDQTAWPGDTLDIRPEVNPTYVCDAQQSLRGLPLDSYDIVLADPPYSVEDAERYRTTMVKRNRIMRRLAECCRPGTHVVWLDQVLPMYRRTEWSVVGVIGMVRSTNHRFRVITNLRAIAVNAVVRLPDLRDRSSGGSVAPRALRALPTSVGSAASSSRSSG